MMEAVQHRFDKHDSGPAGLCQCVQSSSAAARETAQPGGSGLGRHCRSASRPGPAHPPNQFGSRLLEKRRRVKQEWRLGEVPSFNRQRLANALPQKSGPSPGGQAGAVVLMRQFWATGARINAPGGLPFLCACVGRGQPADLSCRPVRFDQLL